MSWVMGLKGADVVLLVLCVACSLAAAVCFVLAAVEARRRCGCSWCVGDGMRDEGSGMRDGDGTPGTASLLDGDDVVEGTPGMVGGVSIRWADDDGPAVAKALASDRFANAQRSEVAR